MGPTGPIRSAQAWYQWIGLGFIFLNFHLEFLKDVQSFKVLIAKIFIVTNGLGGWQVLIFPELFLKSINAENTAGFVMRSAAS